jgi:hypothetical protein
VWRACPTRQAGIRNPCAGLRDVGAAPGIDLRPLMLMSGLDDVRVVQ